MKARRKALISGASVAGPALAYWLNEYGFAVTIVERNDGFRPGGQPIDVRGPAMEVLARMGLREAAFAQRTDMRGASRVDVDGNEVFRTETGTFSGGEFSSPDIEIQRDDLSALLYAATRQNVQYRFADSIAALHHTGSSTLVTFASGDTEQFDLVVGADGIHSRVRALTFGPEARFAHKVPGAENQRTLVAIYSIPNLLSLDNWQVAREDGDSFILIYTAKQNSISRAFLGFGIPESQRWDYHDVEACRELVRQRFGADKKWILPELLEAMESAEDFYLDEMEQIRMQHWSAGRVALVGDAAYCPSPASGQGTSVALVGAYVLAGEIAEAGGDLARAFTAYEDQLRDWIAANQLLPYLQRPQDGAEPSVEETTALPKFREAVNGYQLKDYPMPQMAQ